MLKFSLMESTINQIIDLRNQIQEKEHTYGDCQLIKDFSRSINIWTDKMQDINTLQQLENFFKDWHYGPNNIQKLVEEMKQLDGEVKKKVAPLFMGVKQKIEGFYKNKREYFAMASINQDRNTIISVDLEHKGQNIMGKIHPLSNIIGRIIDILRDMGFAMREADHVESEKFNFDMLNIPANHPARDMQDTFFLKQCEIDDHSENKKKGENYVLRTHTSNAQINELLKNEWPMKTFSIGPVFRNETVDSTHSSMFYQVEIMYVNYDGNIKNLRLLLKNFLSKLLNQNIELRFRHSFFPFVEPGFEVDILFNNKWLEIGGCGIIHQNVFKNCSYKQDIGHLLGFAIGIGVDRLYMIANRVNDIRDIYKNLPHILK